jgi:tetratricopeptide (TPR) repeat protein
MLRPKKKISKRELKQDTLITTYMKATTFYEEHKKQISIGITALVVVVIALVVYFKNQADNNERATTQLSAIHSFYDNGQYQQAIDGVPERNIQGLKSIVENYGNSKTGDLARFYLADAYFQLDKYTEALEEFDSFDPSEALLEASRLAGMAGCYEALGNHKDAGVYFERAAGKEPTEGGAAELLNNAARSFIQAGDKEQALDILKRLKKNYPTTTFGREAERYISQLSV